MPQTTTAPATSPTTTGPKSATCVGIIDLGQDLIGPKDLILIQLLILVFDREANSAHLRARPQTYSTI